MKLHRPAPTAAVVPGHQRRQPNPDTPGAGRRTNQRMHPGNNRAAVEGRDDPVEGRHRERRFRDRSRNQVSIAAQNGGGFLIGASLGGQPQPRNQRAEERDDRDRQRAQQAGTGGGPGADGLVRGRRPPDAPGAQAPTTAPSRPLHTRGGPVLHTPVVPQCRESRAGVPPCLRSRAVVDAQLEPTGRHHRRRRPGLRCPRAFALHGEEGTIRHHSTSWACRAGPRTKPVAVAATTTATVPAVTEATTVNARTARRGGSSHGAWPSANVSPSSARPATETRASRLLASQQTSQHLCVGLVE